MRRFGVLGLTMFLALSAMPLGAHAAESNKFITKHDTVSLVSQSDSVSGGKIKLGLLFRLTKGWHIYWKDAGDAGEPPQLGLTAPEHASAGAFEWPAPDWLLTNGIADYVETGTVLVPFTVTLPENIPATGVDLQAVVHWLVCNPTICVPQQGTFTLHERAGPETPSAQSDLFATTNAALPKPSPFMSSITADGVLTVEGTGLGNRDVKTVHFFPDNPNAIVNAAPQPLEFLQNKFSLTLRPAQWNATMPLSGVLEITNDDGGIRALTIQARIGAIAPHAGSLATAWIWPVIGAFLGGLILNLMPCVFPVLAMKALGVARLGAEDRWTARTQALAYSAGIFVTMAAIGITLLVLRASGNSLGWGFQFQSPIFVAFVTWLIFGIGLNFAGLFEFSSRFSGIGSNLATRGGILGSFATGLITVAVATPCTAPFMGGAIAAALAAPPVFAFTIFFALGFGMALPFLAISFLPWVGRVLPRPGEWMAILRQFMAFPMFATATWLLWVEIQESGANGALVVAGGAVLITFALWLLRFRGLAPRVLTVLAVIGILALLPHATSTKTNGGLSVTGAVPYSATELAALRAGGTPVLVDMSAAWCVTCLVNERVALEADAVQTELRSHHIVLMVGDWTNRDPAITQYLEEHGDDGVPLYIYYPPDHGASVALPQILTPDLVKKTLETGAG
jgi:DsbC/DsbD-like thiol-disulfide interchange protein/cytochrome c biogenesis protein CcdA